MRRYILDDHATLPLGHYRHYKGGDYDVIALAQHSETGEQLVVYRCRRDNHSWWVRPLEMFLETVAVDGVQQPRFRWMGEA